MSRVLSCVLGLGLCLPLSATAEGPGVLIFGGGSDPSSTPLSVEAHVLALGRALARARPQILFAGGQPAQRTVQIEDPHPDHLGAWMGRIFATGEHVGVTYRPTTVVGAAVTQDALLARIARGAAEARGLVVFGAGHGDAAHDEEPAALLLWGNDALTPPELARALDAPRGAGPVALVLGQCHSGAFTDVLYVGADPDGAVAEPSRCVLAAVPADRTAAGCTPDAADPEAHAYLSTMAAALAGAKGADVDGNGKVSLAEAHAWSNIHDDTVDLPVKSSEAWVRKVLGEEAERLHELAPPRVLQLARPEVRAVLNTLRGPGTDAATTRAELDALEERLDALDDGAATLEVAQGRALTELRSMLLNRWPELASPYHRVARSLLSARADELLRAIDAHPAAHVVLELDVQLTAIHAELGALERSAVKLERWLRAYETVALEAALRKRGTPAQVRTLDALLACEALTP